MISYNFYIEPGEFEKLNASVIYGRVVYGNGASARALEKGGYTFVEKEMGAEDDPYGNGMLVYMKEKNSNFYNYEVI